MDDKSEIFEHVTIIDFESVAVNAVYKRTFEVKNSTSIDQVYKVERYLEEPKLDSGFKLTPVVSPTVRPGKVFSFAVELTPKVINMTCTDYFVVRHLFGIETTLFTKATIEGLDCSLSCTQMLITCPSETKKQAKTFEITNNGKTTVKFTFAVDNGHSHVTFNPSHGRIQPSKSICITSVFTPFDHRPFFKRLFCLIENHEPLVLDVYALWLKKNESLIFDVVRENLPQFKNGYHCFMHDVLSRVMLKERPLISINNCYIDFKHRKSNRKSDNSIQFSLTNNFNRSLTVIWNEHFGKLFTIKPAMLELEVGRSATFSAVFQPSSKDLLYGAYLEAQFFSNTKLLPFPLVINVKGHTFDEIECGWAPQYKVNPRVVILPPCLSRPFMPSYSTLTINRFGHLPLAFKFHPPERTNFFAKPQQGLIRGDFEIVLIEFQPKEITDLICIEKWMLSFNSNEDVNQCYVEFGASIETPQLIINHGQEVVFPKTHPQSPVELTIDFYNPTRFTFWYTEKVLKGDSVLMVEHGGKIWPNEHKKVKWTFCPQGVGDLEALVCCSPSKGTDNKVKPTTVVVRGYCEKTTLEVMPHGLIYEKALCEYEHERGFQITNTGEAIISGSLTWLPTEDCLPSDIRVAFEPENFYLLPGSSTLIKVTITPYTKETKHTTIGYSVKDNYGTPLLPVFIYGIFPSLQISDLRVSNAGPLFTKFDFMKTLKISLLNKALEALRPGEKENVFLQTPSFVSTSEVVTVELLLENFSEVAVDIKLSLKNTCECEPVLTTVSYSRSEWRDLCPHKTQVRIFPLTSRVEANGFIVLTLEVAYRTLGFVEVLYNLSITPEDYENVNYSLNLHFGRTCFAEESLCLDTLEPKFQGSFVFNMIPVFIGDFYPFVQAFYLYNNCKHSVFYEVNSTTLSDTPFKYVGNRNTISPLSNHALLFTFLPNSCQTYESFVTLTLNSNTSIHLILKGTGLSEKEHNDVDQPTAQNCEKLISLRPTSTFLSTSHIEIGPMRQSCAQRHVLFFNNKTKDIMSFKWHITKIPEVLEIRVHPSKAAVRPGDFAECRVVVYSRGFPCDITCSLSCVYASFSKYSTMFQKMQKYREDMNTCADYFIVNEFGTENIELAPIHEDWPRKNYLTVSVHVQIKFDAVGSDNLLPFSPSTAHLPILRDSFHDTDDESKLFVIHLLEMVMWEALDDLCVSSNARQDKPAESYAKLRDVTDQTEVAVPSQVLEATMEDVLYSVWQDVFQLKPRNGTENLRRALVNNLQRSSRSWLSSEGSATNIPLTNSSESLPSA